MEIELQAKIVSGSGAFIPHVYVKGYQYSHQPDHLVLSWWNHCDQLYGSFQDLIRIVEVLYTVIVGRDFMPPQYQHSKCNYEVYREAGPGPGSIHVGGGTLWGTPVGNEVE